MSDGTSIPLCSIIISLVLIALNAWFAASRKAISEANKIKIREAADGGNRRANAALQIIENAPVYKLALRIINVLIYMIYCLVLTDGLLPELQSVIGRYITASHGLDLVLAFIIIMFIAIVFLMALGEMLPRRIAMQHAEGVLRSTAGSSKAFTALLKPITLCIAGLTFLFLKIFRQRTDVNDNEYSEEDIVEMLEAGQESGELKEEGKKMITGVFAFDDILAYEIMTPRTDVFAIDINSPADEYIDELMELRYSRIPVYENDSDDIIGILYIKDYLIKAREDGFDNVDIRSILRKPYFIPETKNIDSLFVELQKTKQHIAILIDEYGGFCGIVTMEDIIEEVMGDIDDEYDEEEQEVTEIGKDLYLIEGSMSIDDLNEELGLSLESEDSETIGGLIIDMFGEIPDENDVGKEVFFDNCVCTIKSVKDRRIEQISLKIDHETEESRES